ncbi:MAG TPA: hypothetical protein VG223_08715 [Solirubrobacteraceae bacterium]|jgi:hypothetical protein|nr:hypothetical protein [Solirubrobacteraceae bacterium]
MQASKLDRGELLAVVGGVILGFSLFIAWYSLGNPYTTLAGCHGPKAFGAGSTSCSGWNALEVIRFLLLLAALAPLVLAWIILRGYALSWPRGELTAVTALAALTLIIFRGLIDKPGSPTGEISVSYGWWLAMLGGVMILVGAIWRSQESTTRRKPPGVL